MRSCVGRFENSLSDHLGGRQSCPYSVCYVGPARHAVVCSCTRCGFYILAVDANRW